MDQVSRAADALLTVLYGTSKYPLVDEVELWKAVESLHGKRESKIPWKTAVMEFFVKERPLDDIAKEYEVTAARVQESVTFGIRQLRWPIRRVTFEKKFPLFDLPINDEGELKSQRSKI